MFNSTAKDLCPSYQGGWWGHFAQSKFAKKVDKFWHHCQCGKGPMWYKHLGATSTSTRHQVVVWVGLHQKSGKSGVGDWAPTVR